MLAQNETCVYPGREASCVESNGMYVSLSLSWSWGERLTGDGAGGGRSRWCLDLVRASCLGPQGQVRPIVGSLGSNGLPGLSAPGEDPVRWDGVGDGTSRVCLGTRPRTALAFQHLPACTLDPLPSPLTWTPWGPGTGNLQKKKFSLRDSPPLPTIYKFYTFTINTKKKNPPSLESKTNQSC